MTTTETTDDHEKGIGQKTATEEKTGEAGRAIARARHKILLASMNRPKSWKRAKPTAPRALRRLSPRAGVPDLRRPWASTDMSRVVVLTGLTKRSNAIARGGLSVTLRNRPSG